MSSLILFGFPGCGKTYFGQHLSRYLQYPFIDIDQEIERQHKLSCREIYHQLGEQVFRSIESTVIQGLSIYAPSVIATGGGSLLNACNQIRLHRLGTLIYLKEAESVVKERLWQMPCPAYLDPVDSASSIERLYAERKTIYEQIPAMHILQPTVDSFYDLIDRLFVR